MYTLDTYLWGKQITLHFVIALILMNITNHVINPSENFMNETLKANKLNNREVAANIPIWKRTLEKKREIQRVPMAVKVPVNSIRVIWTQHGLKHPIL